MGLGRVVLSYVAAHRRNPVVSKLAGFSRSLHMAYENFNYDPERNGEHFVLRALAGEEVRTILDVGANVGNWARMAHRIFPQATVHCFEIVPQTWELLSHNVAGEPAIVANAFGLSDADGTVEVRSFSASNELATVVDFPHDGPSRTVECRVTTGDRYLAERGIERVDFLKIDVEGAEGAVLRGFSQAFAERRIRVVQFEYGLSSIVSRYLLRDFYEFFASMDYHVGKIYPTHVDFREYRLTHEDFIGPNFLAVAPEETHLLSLLA